MADSRERKTPVVLPLGLVKLRRNRRKLGIQLGAEAVHDGDNRNGDASGDQAVFDGGGAGFVGQEFGEFLKHLKDSLRERSPGI